MVFNYVVTVENIPQSLSAVLQGRDLSPLGFLLLVNLLLLVLGCLLEGTTILLVIVPVLIPTAEALGIDLVHFGVVVVVNIMLGLITPPYGLLLFMMTKIADVPLRDIVRDMLPFLFAMLAALALITFVPGARALAAAPARLPGLRVAMTRPIHVLNGPNLNRLGMREPEIYGRTTLAEIEAMCREAAGDRPLVFRQSNFEGEIVGWIHEAIDADAGIVINPAGLSFTSIPILDALKMFAGPDHRAAHLQHPPPRGDLPHARWSRTVATAVIAGLGAAGYPLAVTALQAAAGGLTRPPAEWLGSRTNSGKGKGFRGFVRCTLYAQRMHNAYAK